MIGAAAPLGVEAVVVDSVARTGSATPLGVGVAVGSDVGTILPSQALRTAMARTARAAIQRMRRVDTVISVVSPMLCWNCRSRPQERKLLLIDLYHHWMLAAPTEENYLDGGVAWP